MKTTRVEYLLGMSLKSYRELPLFNRPAGEPCPNIVEELNCNGFGLRSDGVIIYFSVLPDLDDDTGNGLSAYKSRLAGILGLSPDGINVYRRTTSIEPV